MNDRIMKFLKTDRGFTLFEIAIVIVILGFVLVPIFAITVQKNMDRTAVESAESRDRTVAAINFYLKQNGVYPAPAAPLLAPGAAGFGQMDGSIVANAGVLHGALPVTALGLPFQAAVNEHGWKYMYAVTEILTSAGNFTGVGAIRVRGLSAGNVATGIHFIVIDPGKDGRGSRSLSGAGSSFVCPLVVTDLEYENCTPDDLFLDVGKADVADPAAANYYDDIVHYKHVSPKNDFWVMKSSGPAGGVELSSRNLGDVGFGTTEPTARLDVRGHVVIENNGGVGGAVEVEGDIDIDGTLLADSISVVEPTSKIKADNFCYGGWAYRSGGAIACCPNNVYQSWNGSGFDDVCGNKCANGQFTGPNIAASCCRSRASFDVATGNCS